MTLLHKFKKYLIMHAFVIGFLGYLPVHAQGEEESANQVSLNNPPYHQVLKQWQESLRDSTLFRSAISPINFKNVNDEDLISATDSRGYGEDVVHLHNNNSIIIEVEVDESGLYNIAFDYLTLGDSMMNPEFSIMINNEFQFNESRRVVAPIYWKDATKIFETNRNGNELIPQQVQVNEWFHTRVLDATNLQPEPLRFYLQEGLNTITMTNTSSEMFLGRVYIQSPQILTTYEEYAQENANAPVIPGLTIYEAQHPARKNSSFIRPIATQNPDVSPYSSRYLLLNSLGGESWNNSGQSVTWTINIEETGNYALSFHVLQDITGASVFRKIKINGEVPFKEMQHYAFDHSRRWTNETLSDEDGNPFYFFFEEGVHEITLVADASPVMPIVRTLGDIRDEIRELSLSIRQLTGGQSDVNREWELDEYIPGLETLFTSWIQRLEDSLLELKILYLSESESNAELELKLIIGKLERLKENPNELPNRMTELSDGASSAAQMMGELERRLQDQPLLLSQIFVHGSDDELPAPSVGFGARVRSGFQQFVASFRMPEARETSERTLDVWVSRSQQHIELLQNMADSMFTPATGIEVEFSVMPSESKLILANSANQQPDLALGISTGLPYQLAIRGAAADLTQFEDFKDVMRNFSPGAFLPFMLDDKVYALPETQDFYVLFYREDMMNQLNIPIPNTWNEVTQILPELQRNGLNFFVPLSGPSANKPFMFTAPFFYQFGGDFYSDDAMSTAINTEESLQAMRFMTDLYMVYSLPLQVANFYNDFRYGAIPIGISNFETYIQLTVAAPEIANAWNIALHPGVADEEGNIARWAPGSAQSGMILEGSDMQAEAWELLKWWMSTETQTAYANNLMTLFGPEFMWSSANLNAFNNLPIPQEHKNVILGQWGYLKEVPLTPASYIVEREVSNIWNRVVFSGQNLRSAVDSSVININREIRRRMEEFGYMENGEVVRPYVLPRLETIQGWIDNE